LARRDSVAKVESGDVSRHAFQVAYHGTDPDDHADRKIAAFDVASRNLGGNAVHYFAACPSTQLK